MLKRYYLYHLYIIKMYYSQFGQDDYIYNRFFKNKKDTGYFLEIGADDGIRFSNCKFFEETLMWTGIALEARTEAYSKLISNRKCICLNAVLSDKEEETSFLSLKGYGLGLSGLLNKYDKRHIQRIQRDIQHPENKGKELIKVNTERLDTLLDKYNIKHIDFLSIDTEGSELDILSVLDFKKYKIDVITIEDNYNDETLMTFFIDRGYKFIKQIKCDKIFQRCDMEE